MTAQLLQRLALLGSSILVAGKAAGKAAGFGSLSNADVESLKPKIRAAWDALLAEDEVCAADGSGSRACEPEQQNQVSTLLAALGVSYESPSKSGAFLDVGAHVGHFTALVLSSFGRLEQRKYAKEFGSHGLALPERSVSVYSFEPLPANFDRLSDRAKRSAWNLEGLTLMKAAISNTTGKAELWATAGIDRHASLEFRSDAISFSVKTVTVDLLLRKTVAEGKAYLVKLSAEGFNVQVLQGAKKSLKQQLIGFLLLEAAMDDSLKNTAKFLWNYGYACFALPADKDPTEATILPVSGPFSKELPVHLSGTKRLPVVCGHVASSSLRKVLMALSGPDGVDYFKAVP